MAQLLTNLMLMQSGYMPVIVKLTANEEYLLALKKADAGELAGFIILINEELLNSLELYLRSVSGESIEELDDLDKKIAWLQKKLELGQAIVAKEEKPVFQKRLQLFDNLIMPLSARLLSKLVKFEPFFSKLSCRSTYERYGFMASLEHEDPTVTLDRLFKATRSHLTVNYLNIDYDLVNFMQSTNYNIKLRMFFNFGRGGFDIHYDLEESTQEDITQQELTSGDYERHYTEEEVSELVSLIANQVYNLIEQRANA